MRTGRRLSAVFALLAVTFAGAAAHSQIKPGEQETPVVRPGDVSVELERVETHDPDELTVGGGPTDESVDLEERQVFGPNSRGEQMASSALLAQVEAELDQAKRRTLRFETAFEKVQRQFVQTQPGEKATVSDEELERFQRDIDVLQARFERVERGYAQLGDQELEDYAGDALGALDTLEGQLALLGLRLEKRGERALVANALEFDFKLLIQALDALHGPVYLGGTRASELMIRPPEGVDPSGMLIRPPEGIEPSREIIRPPEGIEPSRALIRPPEGIEPSDQKIRPAQGIEPSRRIIRPPEGIKPSRRIIRPPTSDNPAVDR